jgi:hypothetical protein
MVMMRKVILVIWVCLWGCLAYGQQAPDPEINFIAFYQYQTTGLAKVNAKLALNPTDVTLYQTRGYLLKETLKGFRKAYKIDFDLYNAYRIRMDSMRYYLITNSVNWLALIPQIRSESGLEMAKKSEMRALLNMGYAYSIAQDEEYMQRIGRKLDTIGYKFPYYSHGPYIGVAVGTHLMVEAGYSLGYMRPRNKPVGQIMTWAGGMLGIVAIPTQGLTGVFVGGSGTVGGMLMLGGQLGFVGNSRYSDPMRNTTTNVVDATILKAEMGYSYGIGQIFGSYNLVIPNSQAPQRNQDNVKAGWPGWVIGTRFIVPFRINSPDEPFKGAELRHGLERP